MEPRFQARLDELRNDARVPAGLAADLPQRLAGFLDPYSSLLQRQEKAEARDGEKGPVTVRLARRLVQAKEEGSPSEDWEMLVVFQEEQSDGSIKHDYLLGRGLLGVPLAEVARVLEARHRIEECLERAKGEAGLGDYQARTPPHGAVAACRVVPDGTDAAGKKSGRRR